VRQLAHDHAISPLPPGDLGHRAPKLGGLGAQTGALAQRTRPLPVSRGCGMIFGPLEACVFAKIRVAKQLHPQKGASPDDD
jgi:hypothetical protein